MKIGDVAAAAGKGLVADAAGTVAITASTTIANKLLKKEASSTPSEAAGKVLRIQPKDGEGEQRLNEAAHVGYGIAWGIPRGLIALTGLGPSRP